MSCIYSMKDRFDDRVAHTISRKSCKRAQVLFGQSDPAWNSSTASVALMIKERVEQYPERTRRCSTFPPQTINTSKICNLWQPTLLCQGLCQCVIKYFSPHIYVPHVNDYHLYKGKSCSHH